MVAEMMERKRMRRGGAGWELGQRSLRVQNTGQVIKECGWVWMGSGFVGGLMTSFRLSSKTQRSIKQQTTEGA